MLALWLGTAVGKDVHKAWPRSFMVRPIWREALLALSEYGRALLYGEARRAFEEARKRFEAAGDRERSEAVARELESLR